MQKLQLHCTAEGLTFSDPIHKKSGRNLNLYNFCHSAKKLTAVSPFKAEHFCQFRGTCKNCSSELFFLSFKRLIWIFSAIFWYCMITRQLIVKHFLIYYARNSKKKFRRDELFLQAPRNWQKCSALLAVTLLKGVTRNNFVKKYLLCKMALFGIKVSNFGHGLYSEAEFFYKNVATF
jgi:hypothetical protein